MKTMPRKTTDEFTMIGPEMSLSHLKERMSPNGEPFPTTEQAEKMRYLLNDGIHEYRWLTISDVQDVDWFRMLDQIVAAAA